MFYLAGQCANESIGLQIDSITATKLNVIINNNGTYGGYTAEGTPIQKLSSSTTIAGRNLSSAMKVGSYAETLGINAGIVPTERIGTPLPEAQDTSTTQAGIDGVGDSSGTIANIE